MKYGILLPDDALTRHAQTVTRMLTIMATQKDNGISTNAMRVHFLLAATL